MAETSTTSGVQNLLQHCAGARPGQRLLIAYEPEGFGYYDSDIRHTLATAATEFGLKVTSMDVGFDAHKPHLRPEFLAQFAGSDIVVFLARLGDQLRFSEMPAGPTIINSFTLNSFLMNSAFGTAHYDAFLGLKTAVDRRVANAEEIVVTCPEGTNVRGRPSFENAPQEDTSLKRFPMSVFSPVPAAGFSGRVALGGFLTGTGSLYYDNYTVEFDGQVFAQLQNGRLTEFVGPSKDVARANAQYDRVAALFEIDRDFVHSWHAGIHPGCGFPWDLRQDYDRWGGAAFGNPRILHFHTCGAYAPGEISWNVFDPTIEIDGVKYWEDGVFHADRLPEGEAILRAYPCAAATFANPDRNIGLVETA